MGSWVDLRGCSTSSWGAGATFGGGLLCAVRVCPNPVERARLCGIGDTPKIGFVTCSLQLP